ncbi:MAG: cation:proton antiporter, partial [Trebonia sp.]
PLMERIDFFGSAVFVPVFLVSVGLLLQPSVMVQPETLKLAGLFVVAAVGGKSVSAFISKRVLGISAREATLMLGLTLPQAAATLAATVIGFNIGLFDQSVVNAVLVLILVSIIVATLITERAKRSVTVPRMARQPLGKRVLVALEDPEQAQLSFTIGARVVDPDNGVIHAMLGSSPADTKLHQAGLTQLHRAGLAAGVDLDPQLLVASSLADGIVNAVAAHDPSLVLVGQHSASAHPALGGSGEAVAASITSPVAILIGETSQIGEVLLIQDRDDLDGSGHDAVGIAAELASRIGGRNVTVRPAGTAPASRDLAPGQLCIAPADSWRVMAASDPPQGAALMLILNPPPTPSR